MTSIRITKSGLTGYKNMFVSGHSGYADEGKDIVCASISAATELVIGILEKFSVDFRLDIRKETACISIEIEQSEYNAQKLDIITNTVGGYADYIKDVEQTYPKFLKCIITEK